VTDMKFTRFVGWRNSNRLYRSALSDPRTRKLDFRPDAGNIRLDFLLDGQPYTVPMSPTVRDLVDVAAMIYVADELSARDATVDRWSRRFETIVPVRAPSAWCRSTESLTEALAFLSGDSYAFEWVRTSSVPTLRNHVAQLSDGFDVVCLFSGGLDSFVGALRLLNAGRRAILIGHQADGVTSSAQKEAFDFFKQRFGDRVSFVQAAMRQSPRPHPEFDLGEKRETSHRPRSFLFLTLAVAVAQAASIQEIVIAENGLIAVNPPLNISRVGTLSTRTAHPKFIHLYTRFLREVGAFEGRIHNPFMYLSKTDVVRLADRRLRARLRSTLSCSHLGRTRWTDFRGQHCGYCVPCLYRRASLYAIGADAAEDYYRDVFTQYDTLTNNERADVAALVSFARHVSGMSTAQKIATATAHGTVVQGSFASIGPDVEDPYIAWAEMLSRWSSEFVAMARNLSPRQTRRRLAL